MNSSIEIPWRLETQRLILTGPDPNQAETVNAATVESITDLAIWMEWAKTAPTVEESRSYQVGAAERFRKREEFHWNLWLRSAGGEGVAEAFAGCIGMHHVDWNVPKFEIGYWARTSMAGNGYITEAVRTVTDLALNKLGAKRVELRMSTRNERSRRVAERAGYMLEATLRNEARHNDGSLRDTTIYIKLV